MEYNKVDPDTIIEELRRIIDRLKIEKKIVTNPDEKKLSNPS